MSNDKKNPLFVVTNNGKDVEEANNLWDAFVKKMGLAPVISLLESLFEELLAQVGSYPMFMAVKGFIDEFVEALENLVRKFDPILAFSLYKR